jgi:hypothetical protein
VQHLLVEEEQRVERLILRGSRDVGFKCKVAEKLSNLVGTHLGRVTFTMKQDVTSNPANVGVLGPWAVVFHTDGLPDLIQQSRLAWL